MTSSLAMLVVALVACVAHVSGHGYSTDPPSRSSAWRFGFNTPPNYDDNQLWCGGFQTQYNVYGGKCGPCGDSWGDVVPRANENTGKYGRGVVTRTYTQGSVISVTFKLTANHKGWVQFSLCRLSSATQVETNECFTPLKLAGSTSTRYYLPNSNVGDTTLKLQLPAGVTCSRCVIQWHYNTGNSWGVCPDGTGALGCGNQENFRTCSDVAIN
ncbi:uncharacterized protein LOC135943627 [Cloeon dipterum]|uniref:uncharacterized protein LOC135943627 n=1 Tax=Cloeon dipterum TaxID=197152 RepID=UPI00322069D0